MPQLVEFGASPQPLPAFDNIPFLMDSLDCLETRHKGYSTPIINACQVPPPLHQPFWHNSICDFTYLSRQKTSLPHPAEWPVPIHFSCKYICKPFLSLQTLVLSCKLPLLSAPPQSVIRVPLSSCLSCGGPHLLIFWPCIFWPCNSIFGIQPCHDVPPWHASLQTVMHIQSSATAHWLHPLPMLVTSLIHFQCLLCRPLQSLWNSTCNITGTSTVHTPRCKLTAWAIHNWCPLQPCAFLEPDYCSPLHHTAIASHQFHTQVSRWALLVRVEVPAKFCLCCFPHSHSTIAWSQCSLHALWVGLVVLLGVQL